MLYSTLLIAAAAFSGVAFAQNQTIPGVAPCCNVSANAVPDNLKTSWCRAEKNTCPDLCGGPGQIANQGNECDVDTLEYTCKCKNGTTPNMSIYQQSVPAQMCLYWYDGCINATVGNQEAQYQCTQNRDTKCGNLTVKGASASSTGGSSATSSPTGSGSSSPSQTSSGASTASSTGAAAAVAVAQEFGMPILAGGLIALFGFAL